MNHWIPAGFNPFHWEDIHWIGTPPGCSDPVRSAGGRSGLGVNQPESGLNYPFLLPSQDVQLLLADAFLAYEDPATDDATAISFVRPFRLAWIGGLGCVPWTRPEWAPEPVHAVDLVIADANGFVVFDSTTAVYNATTEPYGLYQDKAWGDDYHIYEWRTATTCCRIVSYTTWSMLQSPRFFPDNLTPVDGRLDDRVLYRMPRRVRSLKTVVDRFQRTRVDLVAGYNLTLTAETPRTVGLRHVQGVTLDVEPGTGQGLFPGCEETEVVVRKINGVGPETPGDFHLAASDCYWIRQPTAIVSHVPRLTTPLIALHPESAAQLQVGNDCGPCCPCESFVDTAQYLNRLRDAYMALALEARTTRDLYNQNRDRWTAARDCIQKRPLRLTMQPQICPQMDVVAQFCNQTQRCLENVELVMRFHSLPATAPDISWPAEYTGFPQALPPASETPPDVSVACGHTFLSNQGKMSRYELQGEWSEYRALVDAVGAGSSVTVKFRLQFPDDTPRVVEGNLSGTVDGLWIRSPLSGGELDPVASATQSATLECNADNTLPGC